MQFDSYIYGIFLPVVFLLYWALRRHLTAQNALLLAASYLFYGWWDPRFLGLIVFTTLTTFVSGMLITPRGNTTSRIVLAVNTTVNLGILATFKYFDFFASGLIALLAPFGIHPGWTTLNLVLPVGISFYTLQAISYTIDVYRGDVAPTRRLLPFMVYIAFFPQLVAGPIERACNLLPQFLRVKSWDYATAVTGMRQILWGLTKKIVIADTLAGVVDLVFYHPSAMNPMALLLGAVLFAFQIYTDFSGYSDIAIGSARLFGIRLQPNFRYPFFSRSMRELWRRWHISLMTWFKQYVYIPLGGSRHGRRRQAFAIITIFLLSGLWHGADLTFILWGLAGGVLLLPSIWSKPRQATTDASLADLPRCLGIFILFAAVFVMFRANNIVHLQEYVSTHIHGNYSLQFIYGWRELLVYVLPFVVVEWIGRHQEFPLAKLPGRVWLRFVIYWSLTALIVFHCNGSARQYIYFQF